MRLLAGIGAALVLLATLRDAFYTMVLGRRAERALRLSAVFYRLAWPTFREIGKRVRDSKKREDFLSTFGPLSLLALVGWWAAIAILCFGVVQWSVGLVTGNGPANLWDAIDFSGTTLFEVVSQGARNRLSQIICVIEGGLGFGLLGLMISYLPALYQSYSDREVTVLLLDARAGSPPSACALLRRQGRNPERLERQLLKWEQWSAELIQVHVSYPMLAYFRSQHTNQAWLASLVSILDACAVLIVGSRDDLKQQAETTFAVGRHVLVDLVRVFDAKPSATGDERLSTTDFDQLINSTGYRLNRQDLDAQRQRYERYATALSKHFLIALPRWVPLPNEDKDNWQATAWKDHRPSTAVSDPFTE